MSPRSTFQSCGSSSSRVRRRKRPTGVTRGSSCGRPHRAGGRLGVDAHRAELVDREDAAVLADAVLVVEHRARRAEPHRSATSSITGAASTQADQRRATSSARLAARQPARLAEALARRSTSSDAGSRRRSCRCTPRRPRRGDRSARRRSASSSSSSSIGSLPRASARLTTTRSTRALADDARDVVDGADDARVEPSGHGASAGSGSTKPTSSTPSSLRRSNSSRASVDGGAAGADDQQPLGRPSRAATATRTRCASRRAAAMMSRAAISEDAAADDQRREPSSRGPPGRRRRAERLQQPDEQIAAVGGRAQVVEIAVVQADLQDAGDEHGAPQQRPADRTHAPATRANRDGAGARRPRSARGRWRRATTVATSAVQERRACGRQSAGERARLAASAAGRRGSRRPAPRRLARRRSARRRGSARGRASRAPARTSAYGVCAGADDEQRRVDHRDSRLGIGEQADRRGVDDDPVEAGCGLVEDLPHPRRGERAHRSRDRAGRPAAASARR